MTEKSFQMPFTKNVYLRFISDFAMEMGHVASDVEIEYKGKTFDAKSILQLSNAGFTPNSTLVFRFNGEDEAEAAERVARFFRSQNK